MDIKPIGVVHSPFQQIEDMPIQPSGARGIAGTIELAPELVEGLRDLDGFSHLILIYQFHRAGACRLTVTPFLDARPHGVFATRAPSRPNPIGLSIVRLRRIENNLLHIEDVDILDGTPVLDIKPYVPAFDRPDGATSGWLEQAGKNVGSQRSDRRFA